MPVSRSEAFLKWEARMAGASARTCTSESAETGAPLHVCEQAELARLRRGAGLDIPRIHAENAF